ncbi:MAG TPA: hypothetical protein VFC24_16530, partial [Casimicrobiaceae bacterium]|nr:hypothetical protein [Casimicrobiaceae bacterium]
MHGCGTSLWAGELPSELATSTAARLCRQNIETVEAIFVVAPQVLGACVDGIDLSQMERTPPTIERLLIAHYGEPRAAPLRRFLGRAVVFNPPAHGPIPRYASRQLFDRIYRLVWEQGARSFGHTHDLLATDLPDIEPQVTDLVERVSDYDVNDVARFLGARRYAPAVGALVRRLARMRPVNDVAAGGIVFGLARIGTAQSKQALVDRVRSLQRLPPTRDVEAATEGTLRAFAELPADLQPD